MSWLFPAVSLTDVLSSRSVTAAGADLVRVYALVADSAAPPGRLRVPLQGAAVGTRRRHWTQVLVQLPAVETRFQVRDEPV